MTNEEILKKAIEKALKNGWDYPDKPENIFRDFKDYPESLIFDHDFAKAFWGEGLLCRTCLQPFDCGYDHEDKDSYAQWQYHLQQMVLEENPIKYLEQFI